MAIKRQHMRVRNHSSSTRGSQYPSVQLHSRTLPACTFSHTPHQHWLSVDELLNAAHLLLIFEKLNRRRKTKMAAELTYNSTSKYGPSKTALLTCNLTYQQWRRDCSFQMSLNACARHDTVFRYLSWTCLEQEIRWNHNKLKISSRMSHSKTYLWTD